MATKTNVNLEDDLEGGPAEETLRFSLAGAEYEIDVNAANAAEFRRQIASFVAYARKAGKEQRVWPARTAASRRRAAAIRKWAKAQGITVGDRGRIPAGVAEQYEAANATR